MNTLNRLDNMFVTLYNEWIKHDDLTFLHSLYPDNVARDSIGHVCNFETIDLFSFYDVMRMLHNWNSIALECNSNWRVRLVWDSGQWIKLEIYES